MNDLLGITVRPELVYDPKGNEWRERALTAEKQLKAVREEAAGYRSDAAFYRGCALSGEIPKAGAEPSALQGEAY